MTRTRIVALTLIGLAFLSLGYLKVATADDPVSVPKGALAGDLLLDPCTYSTEEATTRPTAERWSCLRTGPIRSHG